MFHANKDVLKIFSQLFYMHAKILFVQLKFYILKKVKKRKKFIYDTINMMRAKILCFVQLKFYILKKGKKRKKFIYDTINI